MDRLKSTSARVGVLDVRDLGGRWFDDAPRVDAFVAAARLQCQAEFEQSFLPPDVLVVVADFTLGREQLERSRPWLEEAQSLIIVRSYDAEASTNDPEFMEFIEDEWRSCAQGFAIPVALLDFRSDDDAMSAVARAREIARSLAPRSLPAAPELPSEFRPGPRIEFIPLERLDLRNTCELQRLLANSVRLTDRGPALETPAGTALLTVEQASLALDPRARWSCVLADGRWLTRGTDRLWQLDEEVLTLYGHWPLGFAATQPVGFTGHRMRVFWYYRGKHGVGHLYATDHDYPCGPAKKLWGYADNEPVRCELASDASVVAQHFEHDVLVTSAVPLRFSHADELLVARGPRDFGRAVYFVNDPELGSIPADLLDEDARDRAPTLVLGTTARARYAVDLSYQVYRLTRTESVEATVTPVAREPGTFAVFDQEHQLVRSGSGRLLGGSSGYALILEGASYVREELSSAARVCLGSARGNPLCSVPVPGTRNVILVSEQEGKTFVQLW